MKHPPKFQKIPPSPILKPYIEYFVISESIEENTYKVLPWASIVIWFQYKWELSKIQENQESKLSKAWITWISDTFKIFKHNWNIATILVYFTVDWFSAFSNIWAHEIMNESISLENIFSWKKIEEIQERLFFAKTDKERIETIESFLLSELKDTQKDKLILLAIEKIKLSNWNLKIKELINKLYISESAFEKRFRKIVGTTPKQFSSIIRLNNLIKEIEKWVFQNQDLYKHWFFDQAHFIKSFKKHTWSTPEKFKRFI